MMTWRSQVQHDAPGLADRGIRPAVAVGTPAARRAQGIGLVFAIVAASATLYAISYPLTDWLAAADIHVLPSSAAELGYLVLGAIGLGLTVVARRHLRVHDLALVVAVAMPVWLAIQAPYWEHGWTPYIPYYEPTLHAIETAFMILGGIVVARRWNGIRMPTADKRYRETSGSIPFGLAVGLVLAGVNVLLFLVQGETPWAAAMPAALLRALKPGILEEVSYRFLFLGLVIVALRGFIGPRGAAIVAISLSAVFHAAIHVPDLFVSSPLAALGTTAVLAVVFGVPLAVLAYRRGIEASIAAHWTIDAVRFSVGL